MELALVTALVGLLSALVTKVVSSWVEARTRVADANRSTRIERYEAMWTQTRRLSTWPRAPLTWPDLAALHTDLRSWYYDAQGGLYLSEQARERYGELQELIAAYLRHGRPEGEQAQVPEPVYTALMESGSALRTALTEDLESRAKSSVILAVKRAFRHRRARLKARLRLREAADQSSPR